MHLQAIYNSFRNFYVWSYDEAVEVAEGVQNYKLKNPEARRYTEVFVHIVQIL